MIREGDSPPIPITAREGDGRVRDDEGMLGVRSSELVRRRRCGAARREESHRTEKSGLGIPVPLWIWMSFSMQVTFRIRNISSIPVPWGRSAFFIRVAAVDVENRSI